ncbi:MAG TPA: VCBS repeat-containing protein [Pseudomonadota bacterium]|nr:VCBS repeat-containing protein [Pseudomonadota bacterium]
MCPRPHSALRDAVAREEEGDVDRDGLPDVVLAGLRNSTAGFVAVFRNQGAGRLPGLPKILELPDTMDDLQLADLDLDGTLDVVGISASASLLIVVLNDGQGNFTFDKTFALSTPAGTAPRTLAVGNVMGNSDPEVIVASDANTSLPGLLLVYQANAGGINLALGINCGFTLFGNVQVRDLDKDGRDDITYVQTTTGALATQLVSNLGIFLSDGAGNFTARPMLSTGAGAYAQVQAVDLDGDQLLDLVGSGVFTPTQQSGTAISVFANQGMANYPATRATYTTLAQPFSMSVGDFNHDGRPDLVVSHILKEGQGHVSTLLNLGAGQGFADVSRQPSYLLGYGDSNVAAADLNSDGKSDFAVVSRGYPKIKQPGQLQVFLNTTP